MWTAVMWSAGRPPRDLHGRRALVSPDVTDSVIAGVTGRESPQRIITHGEPAPRPRQRVQILLGDLAVGFMVAP